MTTRRLKVALAIGAAGLAGGIALAVALPRDTSPSASNTLAASASEVKAASAAATPGVGAGSRLLVRVAAVPILMYHVIGNPPPNAQFPELYVSASDFVGQMRWLERNGYSAVTLGAVWDHWRAHTRFPARPVVITFDDGTRSIAVRARPVLAAHRWRGVLNLDLSNLDPPWGLSPDRVRELIEAGWEINSHTLTHPDLTRLDATRLQREVAGSRRAIQRRFHVPADFFCYPSGRFDDRVVAAVKAAGYLGAMTTMPGLARPDDPYRLARVRVSRSDGVDGFASRMTALTRR